MVWWLFAKELKILDQKLCMEWNFFTCKLPIRVLALLLMCELSDLGSLNMGLLLFLVCSFLLGVGGEIFERGKELSHHWASFGDFHQQHFRFYSCSNWRASFIFNPNAYELSINMQIEPILSGNLPPGFDSSTCRSVWVLMNIWFIPAHSFLSSSFFHLSPGFAYNSAISL